MVNTSPFSRTHEHTGIHLTINANVITSISQARAAPLPYALQPQCVRTGDVLISNQASLLRLAAECDIIHYLSLAFVCTKMSRC